MLVALIAWAVIARGAENGQGVITGTVRLVGSGISPSQPAASLLLGTNQAVRGVIIYLAGLAANDINHETNNAAILDQRNGEFVPRIQIARSGAPLILRNSDSTLHVLRIDSMSGTNGSKTLLQVATPYAGYEKKYQLAHFSEPTLLQVSSANGQDGMAAYIAVMPHPWAVLTDEDGKFVLRNVPAGKHKIYAWHEVLGTLVHEVQVNGTRTGAVDFQFTTGH